MNHYTVYKSERERKMLKRYFPDNIYNELPCGLAKFKSNDSIEIIYANETYYDYFSNGLSDELNISEKDKKFVHDNIKKLEEGERKNLYYKCDTRLGNGRMICISISKTADDFVIGVLWDITEKYNELKMEKDKYAMAMSNVDNIVFEHDILNNEATIYIPSGVGKEIGHINIQDYYNYLKNEMVHPDDCEFYLSHIYNTAEKVLSVRLKLPNSSDYEWYRIYRHFEIGEDGNASRIYGVICNIEDEKRHEKELKQKIEMDPILKIYNRNAAVDRINEYLKNNPDRRDYALFVLDIDDFKSVNDTYGHLYGDAVIAKAAEILKDTVGEKGIVGRYGGDEFFVFMNAVSNKEICDAADAILENISKFRVTEDKSVTCSIGIALGEYFEISPDYKAMFAKADKALYSVKRNGKAHWEVYSEKEMSRNTGYAIEYESDDTLNDEELMDSRDMMKVFLELSANAKTSDSAIYKIIRYVAEQFDMNWLQIMQVNCKEDLITIKYEWCSDPDFRNNAGRSGYYIHSDIQAFRERFEKHPIFVITPENIAGFSPKFQHEFEKNMRYAVLYNANITTDDSFYMFVCTRFDKENAWKKEETLKLNAATKLMTMYVSQADKETENERRFKRMADYDKKTGMYNMQKFYEQIGRLRKLAVENDESVAVIHTDIKDFLSFNRKFGIYDGDEVIIAFANHINNNDNPESNINAHIDGTDIFVSAMRIKNDDREFIDEIEKVNKAFCEVQNEKYPGANLILKTGIYILKSNDMGGEGLDKALVAKRSVKDFKESFCVLYEGE